MFFAGGKKKVAGHGTAGDFVSRSKSDRIPLFYAQKCRIWLSASHKKQSPANGKKRQSRRHYGNKWQYQNSVQCPILPPLMYHRIGHFANGDCFFTGFAIRRRSADARDWWIPTTECTSPPLAGVNTPLPILARPGAPLKILKVRLPFQLT